MSAARSIFATRLSRRWRSSSSTASSSARWYCSASTGDCIWPAARRSLSASAPRTRASSGSSRASARSPATARHHARRTAAFTWCTALRRRSCAISARSDCCRALYHDTPKSSTCQTAVRLPEPRFRSVEVEALSDSSPVRTERLDDARSLLRVSTP